MITNDVSPAAIPTHFVESWTQQIADYVSLYNDNMVARKIMAQRKVGADVELDQVVHYDRAVGSAVGAQIKAKGSAFDTISSTASPVPHMMLQIGTAFNFNRKSLKQDPKVKSRDIDIGMRDIHISEDELALNGSGTLNINGITDAAGLNENGKIVASGASGSDTDNNGAWSGEVGTDIYDDVLTGIGKLGDFDPFALVTSKVTGGYVERMDSERKPYADDIAGLFGKSPKDRSWLVKSNRIAANTAYVVTKDPLAGEYVVSENPQVITYPMGPGQNYLVELYSWSNVEIHDNAGFVEIATS